jgi:hypothetical protein
MGPPLQVRLWVVGLAGALAGGCFVGSCTRCWLSGRREQGGGGSGQHLAWAGAWSRAPAAPATSGPFRLHGCCRGQPLPSPDGRGLQPRQMPFGDAGNRRLCAAAVVMCRLMCRLCRLCRLMCRLCIWEGVCV